MKKIVAVALAIVAMLIVVAARAEHDRTLKVRAVMVKIQQHQRDMEDQEAAAERRRLDCRLQDELFDSQERLAGIKEGPYAEAKLRTKHLSDRCNKLDEVLQPLMDSLDRDISRDLEDQLQEAREGKPARATR